jgi:hypothetical protein
MSDSLRIPMQTTAMRAVLTAYLAQCRAGVTECFHLGAEEGVRLTANTGICGVWFDYNLTASRLIETSLMIVDRLQGGRKLTRRIIVERVTPDGRKSTHCTVIERLTLPSRVPLTPRSCASGKRHLAPAAAGPALRKRRGRGALPGNAHALKDARLRACRSLCGRYRTVIRDMRAAMALYDSLQLQEKMAQAQRATALVRRRVVLRALEAEKLARLRQAWAPPRSCPIVRSPGPRVLLDNSVQRRAVLRMATGPPLRNGEKLRLAA